MTKAAAARHIERNWDERVRANREQVDRYRLVPPEEDFYAPVASRFVQDPRREGDAVLDALLELANSNETWLDIGAGAGRFALPLALHVRRVVALDPSPGMLGQLRLGMTEHGIANVEIHEGRWPLDTEGIGEVRADVSFIAHVGYDVEPIGPFLDAMEVAAERLCVAILLERAPASYAWPFWPLIHGVERVPLPAAPDLVALLEARGARPKVRRVMEPPRRWPDEETLLTQLRQQLWIPTEGTEHERLVASVRETATHDADGIGLPQPDAWIGVITWRPGVSSGT